MRMRGICFPGAPNRGALLLVLGVPNRGALLLVFPASLTGAPYYWFSAPLIGAPCYLTAAPSYPDRGACYPASRCAAVGRCGTGSVTATRVPPPGRVPMAKRPDSA